LAAPFITKTMMKYWPDVVQDYIEGRRPERQGERDAE